MAEALRRAAFLDRDGVINEDRHYVHRIEDFHFLPGAVDALRRLQDAGHALVVVTNQGGVGLGLYSEADVARLHAYMRSELAAAGVRLDAVYHCPHHPRSPDPVWRVPCECRKPAPGMLQRAARELGLDLGASLMVGDKASDLEAARAAGVPRRYLVRSGHALSRTEEAAADAVFDDLKACVERLLGAA
jgi:D-glycero-D-manno-heptose 1,7-bisphosphate phosphatase